MTLIHSGESWLCRICDLWTMIDMFSDDPGGVPKFPILAAVNVFIF